MTICPSIRPLYSNLLILLFIHHHPKVSSTILPTLYLISYSILYLSYPFLTSNMQYVVQAWCPSPHPISFIFNPTITWFKFKPLVHTQYFTRVCGSRSSSNSSTPHSILHSFHLWFKQYALLHSPSTFEYPSSTPQSISSKTLLSFLSIVIVAQAQHLNHLFI